MTLNQAIQVFGQGFTTTRSFVSPCEFARLDRLWVVRDLAGCREPRATEVIVHDVDPSEAHRVICDAGLTRYFVYAFRTMRESEPAMKQAWKRLGYRLLRHKALMALRLERIPAFECPFPIRRIATHQEAEDLNKEAGRRQLLAGHLGGDDVRVYGAYDGTRPMGWVRSGRCGVDGWVSNMFVRQEYWRKGVGKALMSTMLQDDRRLGLERSVLLASVAGSKLYPCLGYKQIGELLLFCPPK